MKNSKEVYREITQSLLMADGDEKEVIARTLMEVILNVGYSKIIADVPLKECQATFQILDEAIFRLNKGEPLQYVLGQAPFFNLTFYVNSSVLIPRPETEELVSVVVEYMRGQSGLIVLDIGTGSGCIPITIASKFPDAKVFGTDISPPALEVARLNAERLGVKVNFLLHDILKDTLPFQELDVIVSNPPYIGLSEKEMMHQTVVEHEPSTALFVPDDDVLVFYRRICSVSRLCLRQGGLLAFEINERYGVEVRSLLLENGFADVAVIKDMSGKDRIVIGINAKI